ncbi:L-threonylcarbamoyladenylate synthase [Acidobacteriota bacterium]
MRIIVAESPVNRTHQKADIIDCFGFAVYYEREMDTRIVRVDPEKCIPAEIKRVARILKDDGMVVYPTDTFYGLGVNCFSPMAIRRAYGLKKRNPSKPLSVVISDREMLHSVAIDIPSLFESLAAEFWPGPLTLVLRSNPLIPDVLLGSQKTIGLRLPDHTWLRELVRTANFPITATSANIAGKVEISDPVKAIRVFQGKVDCVVDGGVTRGGLSSTVVDMTTEKPSILREGAIPSHQLERFWT